VADAARARDMEEMAMARLADGRVYTGQKALKLQLVDRLGNLDDAVQWAGQLAGVVGEAVPVYPTEDKMTFIKKLAETLVQDFNISGMLSKISGYTIK